jgi:hypothetical protein
MAGKKSGVTANGASLSRRIIAVRVGRTETPMALELRPNCEFCDKDLPPEAADAFICSFECTFCADCVRERIHNVCPNCGGGFMPRPIRPATEWRPGLSSVKRPASTKRVRLSYSLDEIARHSARIKDIDPALR